MTGTTITNDTLFCNAGLQNMTVETGLDFFGGEMQWLTLQHNEITMKGWLKEYNSETGFLKIKIEWYSGGGGDSYQQWQVTTAENVNRLATQYLSALKNNNVIIDGSIVSADENLGTAIAKVSFLVGEEIKQKFIVIYKENGILTWKFYLPADNITLYAYSTTGWHYPAFAKRIVAPIQLALEYPAIEVWFRLNNLPIVVESGTVYCYCNVILAEHQALVDALQGVVTIENQT